MKHIQLIIILFTFSTIISNAQKNINTKYLKFKENGKFGLCDTKGNVKVSAKYNDILDFTNDYFILNNSGKCQILDINEKPVFELNKQIIEISFLESGSLLMFDSLTVSVFDNDMKFITTIPFFIDGDEFEETPNFLVFFINRIQYSEANLKLNLYDNKTFKLFKSYLINENSNFDKDIINDSLTVFNIEYYDNNKKNYFDILDINGKPIIEKIENFGDLNIDWYIKEGDSLREIYDYKIIDKLVSLHYLGKDIKSLIPNFTGILKNDSLKTVVLLDLYVNKLKTFNDCEKIEDEEFDYSDNISHFKINIYDKKLKKYKTYLMTRDFTLTEYLIGEVDDNSNLLFLKKSDNKISVFELYENKVITEFTPKTLKNGNLDWFFYNFSEEIIAYKDVDFYTVFNIKTKKKLLTFTPILKDLNNLEEVDVKETGNLKQITFSFRYTNFDETSIDTNFIFMIGKDGNYYPSNGKSINNLYFASAYGLIDSESFQLFKSFYKVENKNDSLIIIDNDDNVIIKTTAKELYTVDNNIGISDGKTSDLYDINLKPLKQNIEGIICATINGNLNEYITKINNSYYYNIGNKSQLLFSENKLMDLPEDFVNHPDSNNYYLPQPINHAQKFGNQLILFQFVDYQGYKLSLYDLKTSEFQKCNTLYYNILTELYDIDNYTYENRFKLLSKPIESEPCFNSYINFTLDTLNLIYDDSDIDYMLEGIKFDSPNIYVFESKTNSSNRHIGTFDSIYYSFSGGMNMYEDEQCFFGSSETFKLINRSTGKLLPDYYCNYVNNDTEDIFIVTNKRTNKQELYRNNKNWLKLLYTGNVYTYELLETYTDKVEGILKLTNQTEEETHTIFLYKNGKLVFDTLKYEIADGGTDFYSNGETIFILKSKTDNSYFVLNLITNQAHKIISNSYYPEFDYVNSTPVMYVYRDSEIKDAGNVDIIVISTGETLKDININADNNFKMYLAENKLFYSTENEDGVMHIYNSMKQLIK